MRIRFNRSYYKNMIEVFVAEGDRNKKIPYRITIERLKPVAQGMPIEPACEIEPEQFEALKTAFFEGLQIAGMYPQKSPSTLEVEAVKNHLEDMRGMASRLLGGVLNELGARTPKVESTEKVRDGQTLGEAAFQRTRRDDEIPF